MALRAALGASRSRLAALLLTEAAALAVAGSIVGLALASWGVALLVAMFGAGDAATPVATSPDGRILAF
ncbi:FtsX-like permease family protein, partial [Pseudomonas aeruginosa]|uniref:FtsX-like permease family protein n=1 Tax=Pseudomonas aeruginosa TaxID=287 RepID=UPI003B0041F8